jgi:cytochrome c-type biogenesis protein CcmH/NrfG
MPPASNAFWFFAGVLAAVAGMLLLWPWLRARIAGGAATSTLPRWAIPVCAAAVVAALGLYLKLGSPTGLIPASVALNSPASAASGASTGANTSSAGSMDTVVAALEARLLQKSGTDADWELLAKSYEFLNRADAAALARAHQLPAGAGKLTSAVASVAVSTALVPAELSAAAQRLLLTAAAARKQRNYKAVHAVYQKLVAMRQMNADTWADYADVTALLNGRSLAGEPEKYLQEALRINPQHSKALWLEGSALHETGRYQQAVSMWQRLAAVMDAGSSDARLIAANLAEDQQLAGAATAASASAVAVPNSAGVAVRGTVSISDALRSRIKAGMTLYILAKSVNSPGAPVAAIRTTTNDWPVSFELNDSQAMLPERKLSTAGNVTVEARISLSGQALSQPGDFIGGTPPLNPADAKPLKLVIERVVQ